MKLIPLEEVLSILKYCEDRGVSYGTIRMYIEGVEPIDPIATIDEMINYEPQDEFSSGYKKGLQELKSRLLLPQKEYPGRLVTPSGVIN